MPLTHSDRAQRAWDDFRQQARANGENTRPSPVNTKAGRQQAERHNHILRMVCLEAGAGAAERLEEDLEEQVCTDDIGMDGKAAYLDARLSIDWLDKDAEVIGEAILGIERFARGAFRATTARAFA